MPKQGSLCRGAIGAPEGGSRDNLGNHGVPLCGEVQEGARSGNPGGRSTKSLPALLADALDETVVVVTIDSRRHKITKREAIVAQIGDYATRS
jgi:hypothetical protein